LLEFFSRENTLACRPVAMKNAFQILI